MGYIFKLPKSDINNSVKYVFSTYIRGKPLAKILYGSVDNHQRVELKGGVLGYDPPGELETHNFIIILKPHSY